MRRLVRALVVCLFVVVLPGQATAGGGATSLRAPHADAHCAHRMHHAAVLPPGASEHPAGHVPGPQPHAEAAADGAADSAPAASVACCGTVAMTTSPLVLPTQGPTDRFPPPASTRSAPFVTAGQERPPRPVPG